MWTSLPLAVYALHTAFCSENRYRMRDKNFLVYCMGEKYNKHVIYVQTIWGKKKTCQAGRIT